MREYETVFVLHPSMDEGEVEAEIRGIQELIVAGGGETVEVERWGRRRLAYEIKKVHEGIYTFVRFKSEPQTLTELDRRYRLNERLLRHLTILSEGPRFRAQAEGMGPREGEEGDEIAPGSAHRRLHREDRTSVGHDPTERAVGD